MLATEEQFLFLQWDGEYILVSPPRPWNPPTEAERLEVALMIAQHILDAYPALKRAWVSERDAAWLRTRSTQCEWLVHRALPFFNPASVTVRLRTSKISFHLERVGRSNLFLPKIPLHLHVEWSDWHTNPSLAQASPSFCMPMYLKRAGDLSLELSVYRALHNLQGTLIPSCLGDFSVAGRQVLIVTAVPGSSLNQFNELSLSQR